MTTTTSRSAGPASATRTRVASRTAPAWAWGQLSYAAFFCLVVPAALAGWAMALDARRDLGLPRIQEPGWGTLFATGGLALLLAAMRDLRRLGRGLPMNAFPPTRFVHHGTYRILRHPIYVGFSCLVLGAALYAGSPAGFWIVTPLVMLACLALVYGYEQHDLVRRFGSRVVRHEPLLRLPADDCRPPAWADRISIYALVLTPWLAFYKTTALLPIAHDHFVSYLPFEQRWPVIEWTELFYISAYLFTMLAVLLAPQRRHLRSFALAGLVGTAVGVFVFVTVPAIAPPREFVPTTALGRLLAYERSLDAPGNNALPSFHVFWALLTARLMARRGPIMARVGWTWGLAIIVSCVSTGQHALADVAAGALLFAFAAPADRIYAAAVRLAQRLANSFRAYRWGPVRVLNHAAYSGGGAAGGVLVAGALVGPAGLPALAVAFGGCVVGAALWGQLVEGSPRLLRPFGYFGAVVGGAAGAALAPLWGTSPLLLLAALATAAPLAQAIGRCRCLVQGCCHGKPLVHAAGDMGIRVLNPASRVCLMSPYRGVVIHPTPLYSMLSNAVIFGVLLRLWTVHAPLALILGSYLLLAGPTRFVEESFRGEPQTRVWAKLAEYQWFSLAFVLAGMATMALPLAARAPLVALHPQVLAGAVLLALAAAAALSVDFPSSTWRFARLTG